MKTTKDRSEPWPFVGQGRNLGAWVHQRDATEGVLLTLAGVEGMEQKGNIKCLLAAHSSPSPPFQPDPD